MISFVHMERGNLMAEETGIVLPWEKDAIWDRTPFQKGTEPMVKVTVEEE